ncbi:hypothetical protein [Nonomuraea guangzhouensis]|uniref:HNH endonuclease n=1 Tax=Nonomuraea guangzhouensis TaxID=1291555 RepID=A0ABW4GW60_9ACTN|nr:hypothetical protein [Nonomuraea guangzhouensis]
MRPGVFKKNAQIAHIYAIKSGAARYRPCRTREEERERDSFKNLVLVCLAHHAAIDDKKDGERLYPPELLSKWKREHEGKHGPQLASIGPISEEVLESLLTSAFTPPVTRLEQIADQLERTGTLNAETLGELRQIIAVMQEIPGGPDARTASNLAFAADVFSNLDLRRSATSLGHAADVLPSILKDLDAKIRRLGDMM